MLVLSRKAGQRIVIGNGVTVTIVEVTKNRVRIGFDAPPEVAIHREELARQVLLDEPVGSHACCD